MLKWEKLEYIRLNKIENKNYFHLLLFLPFKCSYEKILNCMCDSCYICVGQGCIDRALGDAVFPSPWNRMNISHFRNSTPAKSHNDPTMGPSADTILTLLYNLFYYK